MPRYISVGGNSYGVWSNEDGTVIGDAVPAALKTTEINNKISSSQKQHQGESRRR